MGIGGMRMLAEKNRPLAIVTGGGKGIGQAICLALAQECGMVVVTDISADLAMQTVEIIGVDRSDGVAVDVSSEEAIMRLYSDVMHRFGGIDILVNNAGIFYDTAPLDIGTEEWDRVMAVNARGTFLMSREALKFMTKAGRGRIVNVASTAGKTGGNLKSGVHYAASKAAVICITKSLARYAAPYKVNVNAVCPGPTETDLTQSWGSEANREIAEQIPWREFGKPADVANAVAFLASERARYITGEILNVSGGIVMD